MGGYERRVVGSGGRERRAGGRGGQIASFNLPPLAALPGACRASLTIEVPDVPEDKGACLGWLQQPLAHDREYAGFDSSTCPGAELSGIAAENMTKLDTTAIYCCTIRDILEAM